MTNRDFDEWLSKFRPGISTYDYYVDFCINLICCRIIL